MVGVPEPPTRVVPEYIALPAMLTFDVPPPPVKYNVPHDVNRFDHPVFLSLVVPPERLSVNAIRPPALKK